MKPGHLFTTALLFASLVILSCGSKDKKKDEGKSITETTVGPSNSGDGMVPNIDTASLKDEASILAAMQIVVDARLADEKKQKEDPEYDGHYVELTNLYSAVLNASTKYMSTIADPNEALKFSEKVSAIQNKMYAK
jgi:hypothetical protein